MAYSGKAKTESKAGTAGHQKDLTRIYFEERECRFGDRRFSVLLPRRVFADMILNHPPAGAA